MKFFISLILFWLFISFSIAVHAQTVSSETTLDSPVCSQKFFEETEDVYNRNPRESETRPAAEKRLKQIVSNCADAVWIYQAEAYLKIVEEESAEHSFKIARYYYDNFRNGKGGFKGAVSRLKTIIEKYPNYSQIISVKQMLDELETEPPANEMSNN